MRYMMIVKTKEGAGMPPKELMEAIAKMSAEATKSGTMLGSGGLRPTSEGSRVRLAGGKITVLDGPFTEGKEVIGGFAQFEAEVEGRSTGRREVLHGTPQAALARMGGWDRSSSYVRGRRIPL